MWSLMLWGGFLDGAMVGQAESYPGKDEKSSFSGMGTCTKVTGFEQVPEVLNKQTQGIIGLNL